MLPETHHRKATADEAPSVLEQAAWRKRAREFVYGDLGGAENRGPSRKKQKINRIPSYRFLCSWDVGMRVSCGFGLNKFLPPGTCFAPQVADELGAQGGGRRVPLHRLRRRAILRGSSGASAKRLVGPGGRGRALRLVPSRPRSH